MRTNAYIAGIFVSILSINTASSGNIVAYEKNRVAVVDTGLDINSEYYKPFLCKKGHKDFTKTGIQDNDGHGTEIVDLIIKNAKTQNYCLIIYKFFTATVKKGWNEELLQALEEVHREKIKIANLSLSGEGFIQEEDEYFRKNNLTLFITAAGNDGVDLDKSPRYPAYYNHSNILVVGAIDPRTKKINRVSNYGKRVLYWEEGTATSYATAVKTGKLIEEKFGSADELL
jgi:hypothetical protein